MVSIKAPLFSCPQHRQSVPSWLENSCFSLCARATTHWGKKNSPLGFFFLCGGSFRDVDLCERAFSRRHQFDVYCIKRGRAWPRENIKASSISWEKKKKIAERKFITHERRQRMGKSRFFLTSGYRSAPLKGNHSRSILVDFIIFFVVGDGVRWWSGGFFGGWKNWWSLEQCVFKTIVSK